MAFCFVSILFLNLTIVKLENHHLILTFSVVFGGGGGGGGGGYGQRGLTCLNCTQIFVIDDFLFCQYPVLRSDHCQVRKSPFNFNFFSFFFFFLGGGGGYGERGLTCLNCTQILVIDDFLFCQYPVLRSDHCQVRKSPFNFNFFSFCFFLGGGGVWREGVDMFKLYTNLGH